MITTEHLDTIVNRPVRIVESNDVPPAFWNRLAVVIGVDEGTATGRTAYRVQIIGTRVRLALPARDFVREWVA